MIVHLFFPLRDDFFYDKFSVLERGFGDDDAGFYSVALNKEISAGPDVEGLDFSEVFFGVVGEVDEAVFFGEFFGEGCFCVVLF